MATRRILGPWRYRRACLRAGLDPTRQGWGLVLCLDPQGKHITLVTDDVPYVEMLQVGQQAGVLEDLELPPGAFPIVRLGWPEDWPKGPWGR